MSAKTRGLFAAVLILVCLAVVGISLRFSAIHKPKLTKGSFDFILANLSYSGNRLNVQVGKTLLLYAQTTPKLSDPVAYNLTLYPSSFCCGTSYAWYTDNDGTLTVLDLQTRTTQDFKVPETQAVVSCDDTGATAVFGAWNGDVAICRPFGLTWILHTPAHPVIAASASGDGKYCAAATQDDVLVWDIKTRKLIFDKKDDVSVNGLTWDSSTHSFWDTHTVQYIRQISPSKKNPLGENIQMTQTFDGPSNVRVSNRQAIRLFTLKHTTILPPSASGPPAHITIDPDHMGYQTICRIGDNTIFKKPSLSPSTALNPNGKEFAYISDEGALTVVPIPEK